METRQRFGRRPYPAHMPIRSVAELLPRPFESLTLDDVREIVAHVSAEKETIFFERKAIPRPDGIAKSCAAFANTLGGVLVVGVSDGSDELVGFEEPKVGDAGVWVKDVIRPRVTPLPPFRARTFDVDGTRRILLVLVERSSTTPHLLTRQGAIYVRSPGSSDPLPIHDQRTLSELIVRGEAATSRAADRTEAAVSSPVNVDVDDVHEGWTLGIAPTGVSNETTEILGYDPTLLQRLVALLPSQPAGPRDPAQPVGEWEQDRAVLYRIDANPAPLADDVHTAAVWRDGVIAIDRRYVATSRGWMQEHLSLTEGELVEALTGSLNAAREFLLEVGAHGEICIRLRVALNDHCRIHLGGRSRTMGRSIVSSAWGDLTTDAAPIAERFVLDVGRSLGARPGPR